ncbi:MAG: Hsp70 family protein [bacterium]
MKDGIYLGIDFGTATNYVTKWDFKKTDAMPVENLGGYGGGYFWDNVIYYESPTNYIVGEKAYKKGVTEPLNFVKDIKRYIEDDKWRVKIKSLNKELAAVDVAADIFRVIKDKVEKNEGGKSIDGIVISVPFAFQHRERQKIKLAAEKAGLKVMGLIEEPIAAAISFGLHSKSIENNKKEKILVFDLGGGTFDVTIFDLMRKSDNSIKVEVLNTDGHKNLGGKDIDSMLVEQFLGSLGHDGKEVNISDEKKYKQDQLALVMEARKVKEELSEADEVDVYLARLFDNCTLDIEGLTREEFNNWLRKNGFVSKVKEVLYNSLEDIDLEVSDIERIILVGGSSNIPYIQDLIEKTFHRKAESKEDVGRLVGHGAGIYCGKLLDNSLNYEVITKVSHDIGIKLDGRFLKLIKKNERYETFSDYKEIGIGNQAKTMSIGIYQGVYSNKDHCSLIGKITLDNVSKLPEKKIKIKLGTDKNGIVKYILSDVKGKVIKEGEVTSDG